MGGCKGKRSIKSNCGNGDTGAIVPATGPIQASSLLNRVTARVLIGVKNILLTVGPLCSMIVGVLITSQWP